MAEYDGSVRIGVKVELDNAKKQLEHLRNRLANQTAEVDKQAQAVQKLKAAFNGLSSKNIQVKGASKLWDNLKLATYEAYKLRNELERLQEVSKGEIAENGVLSAETAARMEEISTALMDVTANADLFRKKLYKMDIPAEELDRAIDKMRDLAGSTIGAENGLRDLQLVAAKTEQEIQSAEVRVNQLSAEMQAIKDSAVVANQGIVDLRGELSKLESELDDMKAAGLGLGDKPYDDVVADIARVKKALKDYEKSLIEAAQAEAKNAPGKKLSDALYKSSGIASSFKSVAEKLGQGTKELFRDPSLYLGKFLDMVDRTAARLKSLLSTISNSASQFYKFGSKIKSFLFMPFKSVANSVKNVHSRMEKVGRSRGLDKARKSASRLSETLRRAGRRLREIVSGALLFNIISRALTALTKKMGEYLTANKEFSNSLSTIKWNLLTAFQPIYDAVMPALNSLLETLREASAVAAKFVAGLFGTTAEKAQQNAKALHDQAKATEEVAEETKKAEKFLASFDTIEILGNKGEESKKSDEKEEKAEAKFDQDYADVKVPPWLEKLGEVIKSIKDALKDLFAPIKEAWDKYGAPVIEALKRAFSSVWELIKAIGRTFMEIWQSPLIQSTLKLIMDLLTLILNIIGDIADTFRKVWESGEGKTLLTNLTLLLNTILGIIYDIAAAFQAAWSNYGESVVQALFFALNSVLELLQHIGQSFRDAWNDNGRGQKIFETILQIVRDIFNTIGELANRLREAWEANGNGQAIWAAILDSVQHILDFIHNITSATHEWAQSIDFEPLISSIRDLLERISPLIDKIGKTASDIYKNTVLPFLTWLIETAIPRALDLFGEVSRFLTEHDGLWDGVKNAVSGVFDFITELADKTLEWAENLDLESLATSFQNLLDHLPTLLDLLSEIYEDVILPLCKTLIEDWLPRIMDWISNIIDFLSENKEVVEAFVTAWALSGVVSLVSKLASSLSLVTLALAGAAAAVAELMQNWGKMNDMERSLAVIGAVMAALGALCVMLFAATGGVVGVVAGVAAVVAGIAMVNSAVKKASSGHSGFSMGMFGGTVGTSRAAQMANMARIAAYTGTENIPHLAKGAVISPNSEFLAVLGDQRAGTNIESPLSTIEQALDNVLSRRGEGSSINVEITYTGSLSQLARILQPQIKVAEQRRGPSLVNIGGDSYG